MEPAARSPNGSHAMLGIAGFLVGGALGFIIRPAALLVGQLPFDVVITRGAHLKGMDQLLVPIAQQSFNYMIAGAIIGTIVGVVIAYIVKK